MQERWWIFTYISSGPTFCPSLFQNKTERGESIQMAEVCDPGPLEGGGTLIGGIRYKSAQMSPENLYTRETIQAKAWV